MGPVFHVLQVSDITVICPLVYHNNAIHLLYFSLLKVLLTISIEHNIFSSKQAGQTVYSNIDTLTRVSMIGRTCSST